jgi:HAD superfamily hydrolase (TIGR01509 family)
MGGARETGATLTRAAADGIPAPPVIWDGASQSIESATPLHEIIDGTTGLDGDAKAIPQELVTPMEGALDPSPPALEALTVDLWYTLIYPTPPVRARIERARRTVWAESLRESGCSPKRASTWAARIDRAAEAAELEGWSPSWHERVERWSRRIGVPIDADRLAERFVKSVPLQEVRVAAGADQALARLKRRGFRLAIVSNVTHEPPQAIHGVIEKHGLDRRFDVVVLSTDVGRAKPRREPFRKALSELGAAPGRTVHIGDAAVDFQGARAAGIRPLLFTGLSRWKPEQLRKMQRPWMKGALKVSRWVDVPRTVAFYETLPSVPREV